MQPIDPDLRIRSVDLAVSDLARSIDFYERVLGMPVVSRGDEEALLGTDTASPALRLRQLAAPTMAPPTSTGLYHVAWLHPSRGALAATVRRALEAGWRFEGASDHGVSEALYLSDPDGLGVELYADRPRERWTPAPDGHGVDMYTLPLDVEDLLAQAPSAPEARIAPGTFVGHIHLKVADVARSVAFYGDALGFEEQARLPSAAFLAAGGYHHHVGLNSWQSEGAGAPPESAPGLRRVEFELRGGERLTELELSLEVAPEADPERENGTLTVHDPDGQMLVFAQR